MAKERLVEVPLPSTRLTIDNAMARDYVEDSLPFLHDGQPGRIDDVLADVPWPGESALISQLRVSGDGAMVLLHTYDGAPIWWDPASGRFARMSEPGAGRILDRRGDTLVAIRPADSAATLLLTWKRVAYREGSSGATNSKKSM